MKKYKTKKLVLTGLMLAMAIIFQVGFSGFAQPVVGPLVNMTLFICVMLLGPLAGVFVGTFTPIIAFILGIMPLFPVVPFIIIANGLLVTIYYYVAHFIKFKYSDVLGVIISALFKFMFLAASVRGLLPLFMAKVPGKLVVSLSFTQFVTALIGGSIAIVIFRILNKALKLNISK